MTAAEALEGFKRLQESFPGRRYKGAELNAVWPQLLLCRRESFERAVGTWIRRGKFLPATDYILAKTREFEEGRGESVTEDELVPGGNECEGTAAIRLMRQLHDGVITEAEWIAGMYRMSTVYGKAEYAQSARWLELKREQEALSHDDGSGADSGG